MTENEKNVSLSETKRIDNKIMLFSGLVILLGDIVLFLGVMLGGLQLFNVPFSIENLKDIYSNINYFWEDTTWGMGNVGFAVVTIVMIGLTLGLAIDLLIAFISFFRLLKLNANSEKARKNFSFFLRFGGAMYGVCGGCALCSVAMNGELPIWSIAMIFMAFFYIVLMAIVRFLLNYSVDGVGNTVLKTVGVAVLCAVVVAVALLYAKSVMTTAFEAGYNLMFYPADNLKDELVNNAQIWTQFCIALVAGTMLSSTVFCVSPIYKKNGKKITQKSAFIFGIVMVVIAIGLSVAEMFLFESEAKIVLNTALSMIPLFLCSVAGLVAVEGLLKKKNA